MADPISLIEFATQKRDTLQTASKTASTRLATAQQSYASAVQAHKQACDDLTAANQTITNIKNQLATIEMPADGEPLLDDLRDAIIDQRDKETALSAADLARGMATAELDLAQTAMQSRKQALDAAEGALSKAKADKQKRDAAMAALAQAPLSDVPQEATDALVGSDFSAAKQRIQNALPEALRTRAKQRCGQAAGALLRANSIRDQAQNSYYEIAESGRVNEATIERLSHKVFDAEKNLLNFVSRATQDLAAAQAILEHLADTETDQLTEEERAHIHDAALATEREEAATAETVRDASGVAVAEKLALLEVERIKVLADDPSADLAAMEADNSTEVGEAKEAWNQANADLATEEGNFSAAQRQTLSEWQAAVPEFLWDDAASFYRAETELNRLKGDPATLSSALQTAEQALLAALITQETLRQRFSYVSEELSRRGVAAEEIRRRIARRQADALRGSLML